MDYIPDGERVHLEWLAGRQEWEAKSPGSDKPLGYGRTIQDAIIDLETKKVLSRDNYS